MRLGGRVEILLARRAAWRARLERQNNPAIRERFRFRFRLRFRFRFRFRLPLRLRLRSRGKDPLPTDRMALISSLHPPYGCGLCKNQQNTKIRLYLGAPAVGIHPSYRIAS
jgi:hypothetical protein